MKNYRGPALVDHQYLVLDWHNKFVASHAKLSEASKLAYEHGDASVYGQHQEGSMTFWKPIYRYVRRKMVPAGDVGV